MYKALATAPMTIPITSKAKKKSGQNQPYDGRFADVIPNPYNPAHPMTNWAKTSTIRNSGS